MKTLLQILVITVLAALSNQLSANSILSDRTFNKSASLETSGEKSSISHEQVSGFLDENGNPLFSNLENKNDTLETDAIQERILNGLIAGDEFGYSVSGAGDVNGDGYQDVIVGVPFNDAGGVNAGRVYIYFGGVNFNSSPDKIFTGTTGVQLGYSVSGAGDVNGDGYDDVIIGLPAYSTNTGRAYIYLGGSNMNLVVDAILTGEATNNYFGTSVSDAGDVNGDGFADVIVGAPNNASNTGEAYIYYGGSVLNNAVDVTLNQGLANNLFGLSVSKAGDFNGDGFGDVIVGASGYLTNVGRAYIYYGGSPMNSTADNISFGFISNEFYGYSVSDAGDFNGDGYSDVVIGAYGHSLSMGRAYILYGGATPDNTVDVVFTGQNIGDELGRSVSSAGDVNGDGYDDVIAGAPNFNSGEGSAYLYRGGETPVTSFAKILPAENAGDRMGHSVSGCGDINGDGNDEFIVSATLNDQNGTSSGRLYIYFNSMTGNDVSDLNIYGSTSSDFLGFTVSDAGDVNGDGFDDIIVGAPAYNSNQGRAYIYYGGNTMNNVADVTLSGAAVNDRFAISVSGAGDVNGDGFDDVIAGAYGYNDFQGRAYIFYGGSSMNSTADVTMTGGSVGDDFGISVSRAGDFNNDGFSDVIVSAQGYSSERGRAYLYLGSNPMNNTSDLTFAGIATGDNFGNSVSDAGDVNGDGYSDIIIGAYYTNSNRGEAYIYYGGSILNNDIDVQLTGGISEFDYFGCSVSGAGDINGDGFSDVIVGAYGYSGQRGRAYVYYGSLTMNNSANLTVTGLNGSEFLGFSVSDAGDVNGDNYDDFIIGVYGSDNFSGSANIYFGGSIPNSTADIILKKENPFGNFGYSVSGAGDLNNDGFPDVVSGEPSGDIPLSNSGSAFVYFSSPMTISPRINSVKDVPFDQGGKVKIQWNRSGFDYVNQNLITDYLIEISDPPGVNGFYWGTLAEIPASFNSQYQYTADTPNDSMDENSGVFFYRITARTSDPDQFWRSNIMSGYSRDNLAPAAPLNLSALPDNNSVELSWNENEEPDLGYYIVYRNGIELGISANLNFNDPNVEDDSVYNYQIAAVDIHGNVSELSNIAVINFNTAGQISISLVIEGFYNSSNNKMTLSDTVTVYLRGSSPPYNFIDSSTSVVNGSSLTGNFKFYNAPTGNYYIVIRHRNTVETWSSSAQSYIYLSNSAYDFSSLITSAYGNNMQQVDLSPVRFGIYSGDVNQDGTIDLTDGSLIDNDAFNFASGYLPTDVNGDDVTDLADAVFADNNAFNFVSTITP
ncbi:MAG: FG-GAP repeat protein [Ignavibacteria bacterium]|nr:FG-GAP repeat protein [Ignavibacteria bacterium]